MVVWHFEEGGVVLCRWRCGTLKMVVWYFEEGNMLLVHIIQELDRKNLRRLSTIFARNNFEAGATIVTEGQRDDSFFMIVSGSVRVYFVLNNKNL